MNTQQFLKGLLMALVAVAVTIFGTTPISWTLAAIFTILAILQYFGKNLIPWLHSDSPVGSLSLINVISGILIALSTGITDGLAMFFVNGAILWPVLGKLVLSITFTYLGSTLFAPPYSAKKVQLFGSIRRAA